MANEVDEAEEIAGATGFRKDQVESLLESGANRMDIVRAARCLRLRRHAANADEDLDTAITMVGMETYPFPAVREAQCYFGTRAALPMAKAICNANQRTTRDNSG